MHMPFPLQGMQLAKLAWLSAHPSSAWGIPMDCPSALKEAAHAGGPLPQHSPGWGLCTICQATRQGCTDTEKPSSADCSGYHCVLTCGLSLQREDPAQYMSL